METITAINNILPMEIANIIYSYLGESPTAKLITEYNEYLEEFASEAGQLCNSCDKYKKGHEYGGKCEYCYAEILGEVVYSCDDCNVKCFEYGRHTNTLNGLFCRGCMKFKNENGECLDWFDEEDDEIPEDDHEQYEAFVDHWDVE